MLDKTKQTLLSWMPDWEDQCVAIVASGGSVRKEAVNLLKDRIHVVAVNNCFELCPWAEMLYACDAKWWRAKKGVASFKGIKVSADKVPEFPDINQVEIRRSAGIIVQAMLFDRIGEIGAGGNSGFQALNIMAQMKVSSVALLGFDMCLVGGQIHWHGRHPDSGSVLYNPDQMAFDRWIGRMNDAAPILKSRGIEVVNCSSHSALKCFPKMTIQQTFERWGL